MDVLTRLKSSSLQDLLHNPPALMPDLRQYSHVEFLQGAVHFRPEWALVLQ